ncbi:3-oxoacyl-ACP reductase FabG [Vagococcus carniphilus]|uniref:3-oxoacyl-ACP reductase FabG n=1 Tax=Vagococcus carniphilus TaxID=218144 RepID=A0AAW8U1N5_9ENTE|nr:3-oxoacyl-ACP reductase FabG [Vagococcus carniphilus]MDT2814225.1 3-oxoacyl-ACP reductase FabG [Vagococcus carniphilus]MDT2829343.1 3-oxoacyl-ACP reductase FabG [Vagococcus carniphilus]MDT2833450.1 3-oxoacyl-ACP reductase FabG [Vagococcus carniphilus]MDT2838802.1 3-oxoacyl-ACP reductase FabG [Vagococcus carniphilus]MDT2852860.1 3-oxoacyl-ACP reductase FabG [Vagococcus carniphilus]
MKRFEDKIVIVTGAARGIGRTVAELMLEQGAKHVYSLDVAVGDGMKNFTQKKVDISNRDSVEQVIKEIVDESKHIDVLVNNAGVTRDGLVEKISEENWDFVIDINLKGTFNVTQAVVPFMKETGKGAIVNLASIVGEYGNIGQTNYAATKAGVIGMSYTWAKEFTRKGENIRTNVVAPGYVNTEMVQSVPEKIIDRLKEQNPMKRLAEPIEIANAIAFLASDEASFVNGHVLSVNGGMRI